jgi:hypothetical protein
MAEHLSSSEKSCDELETSDLFQTETVDNDEAFAKLSGKLDNWVFRGHNGPKFGLKTTLELECGRHNLELYLAPEVEKKLLREFGRRVHLYLKDSSQIPDPGDTLEWISLMRHYGAPTRVLDWTYSIHVAAHFALNSSENDKPCWIWAIDPKKLDAQAETLYSGLREPRGMTQKSGAHFREHFMAPRSKYFCLDRHAVSAERASGHPAGRVSLPWQCDEVLSRESESHRQHQWVRHQDS